MFLSFRYVVHGNLFPFHLDVQEVSISFHSYRRQIDPKLIAY